MLNVHTPIVEISIDQLIESPFNPRKTFTDIEALAADIKTDGRVLQPLLVRPIPGGRRSEVVFGHRRLRAAVLAGLATVPCMVRDMTDEEARRAQIRENLQRTDVHPIEEAEGFQALLGMNEALTADQLAADIGRSKSYVYGRLKLLLAVPRIREACLKGEIGSETALLIARLRTEKLQHKALQAIEGKYLNLEDGGEKSYRRIRELLAERFTLELKGAIFPLADETLLPAAGACTTCPKRTGNAPEFADLVDQSARSYKSASGGYGKGSADVCTDPDCFDAKKRAHLALKAQALQAKGETLVTGNKARQAVGADGKVKGDYVPLADVKEALKKVAADKKPTIVTIINPRDGKIVKAVARDALRTAGVKVKAAASTDHNANYAQQQRDWQARQKERDRQERIELGVRQAIMLETLDAMAKRPRDEFDLRLLALTTWAAIEYNGGQLMLQRRGMKPRSDMAKALDGMDAAQLTLFCMECALVVDVAEHLEKPSILLQAAAHYGVDAAAIRKRGEEADAREAAPAAAAKTKKTPAGTKVAAEAQT